MRFILPFILLTTTLLYDNKTFLANKLSNGHLVIQTMPQAFASQNKSARKDSYKNIQIRLKNCS